MLACRDRRNGCAKQGCASTSIFFQYPGCSVWWVTDSSIELCEKSPSEVCHDKWAQVNEFRQSGLWLHAFICDRRVVFIAADSVALVFLNMDLINSHNVCAGCFQTYMTRHDWWLLWFWLSRMLSSMHAVHTFSSFPCVVLGDWLSFVQSTCEWEGWLVTAEAGGARYVRDLNMRIISCWKYRQVSLEKFVPSTVKQEVSGGEQESRIEAWTPNSNDLFECDNGFGTSTCTSMAFLALILSSSSEDLQDSYGKEFWMESYENCKSGEK